MGIGLTGTQQKIFDLICKCGIFNREKLAKKMGTSVSNINSHLSLIYEKKNVSCMAEMVYNHWRGNAEQLKRIIENEIKL